MHRPNLRREANRTNDHIDIVRSRGHDAGIRIIGPLDASPYSNTIASLAQRHREWVLLEGRKVGGEKARILAECRYGIHGREGGAFGIAVAEMVKAGCITFAPAEGGPAEILNNDALLYYNDADAAQKIGTVIECEALREKLILANSGRRRPTLRVIECEALREKLIRHLRRQADKFSPEAFMSVLRDAVHDFLHPDRSVPDRSQRRLNAKAG